MKNIKCLVIKGPGGSSNIYIPPKQPFLQLCRRNSAWHLRYPGLNMWFSPCRLPLTSLPSHAPRPLVVAWTASNNSAEMREHCFFWLHWKTSSKKKQLFVLKRDLETAQAVRNIHICASDIQHYKQSNTWFLFWMISNKIYSKDHRMRSYIACLRKCPCNVSMQ